MNFQEFYENIFYIFPEELDSKQIDDAYKMAKKYDIGVLSDKEIYTVAMANNEVVGALWTSWLSGEFSCDIVVREDYQRRGIGRRLTDIAIQTYNEDKEAYGEDAIMRIDVINPKMEQLLLSKGFKVESRQPGHIMMIKK